ncbi:uncharacterized protein LOC131820054 [Mustela lutreola]|uniref:uncharacterized protein LOC131820054 n=1 Tax=Mustela lutreola TaxID=9666 RepID=UPI002797C11D|nr:uncharacterized protein LOC131820054 [Mustela lutreola]
MGADAAGGADGGGGGSGGGGNGSVRSAGGFGGGSSDAADSGFEVTKGHRCTSGFGSEGLRGSSGGGSGISVGVGGDSSGSGFSGGTSGVGGGAGDFSGGTSNASDDGVKDGSGFSNGGSSDVADCGFGRASGGADGAGFDGTSGIGGGAGSRCKQHWRRQLGCTSGDRLGVQGSSGSGGGGSSGGAHSGISADCVGCTSSVGDSSGGCGADGSNADGSGGAAAGAVQAAAAGARGPATEEGQSYGHGHGHSRFSEGNEHQAKQQLVLSLPDPFCLGPHGIEVLWKLLILTAFLGTCAFLIYLWRTILAIKPRQYEVTLDQIKMKINNLKNENRDLEKNIASWEEKAREAKKQAETKREHKRSLAGVRKLKAQDALVDQELRALTSKNQELKERKTFLEDQCNALSSKEAELNLLKKKLDMVVEFSENQKLTAEE